MKLLQMQLFENIFDILRAAVIIEPERMLPVTEFGNRKGRLMEIERKFLISALPDLSSFPYHEIEQAYLNEKPGVRIRKSDDRYILTVKGEGILSHEEYELPLSREAYLHLLEKADGRIITKRRYKIPFGSYTIELDLFSGCMDGLILAEVEFPSVEEAERFTPPDWFAADVTYDPRYRNAAMAYGQTDLS